MSSRVWPITSELRGLMGLTTTAGCSLFLPALLALSGGFALAQTRPTEIPKTNSSTRQYVSVNQLLTPGKAQRAVERARRDFLQGRLDSALKETERALEISPRCATALSIQGAVNLSRYNYTDASRRFQEAVDADPAFGPAYLGLGTAYTSQGRFKEALIPLDRAASFLPNSWIVYFEIAYAHLGLGEPETALKQITYAERFTGADPEKRAGISYLRGMARFEMKDYRKAQEEFNEAVGRDGNGIFAVLAKGKLKQLASASNNPQVAQSSVYNPF